ncbi:HNH endonuclease family protein [Acinetobacter haemolyticus]|uniref:HNH endonuclease family protein n=1 Tax=Acinetobacter haemolyticus TaxID=29430 RepID=UPI002091895A|nr:HNH endonuclease family protein [Acinetobacter haemolyticus]
MGVNNPQYRQRFILGQLENQARTQAGLSEFNFKQIGQLEIEHIFPQTPKDDVLPEEFLDKAEYNNTIYKLGNVTLLESVINQAINKMNDLTINWFEQKQQEYKKSILLTVNLLDHQYNIGKNTAINRFKEDKNYIFENWSKQAITDRQQIMLDLALDAWRFNDQRLDQYQFSIEHKDTVNA